MSESAVVDIERVIDEIGQELLATELLWIKGNVEPTEEEVKKYEKKRERFKKLCATYALLKKSGRVSKQDANPNFGDGVLKKIKEQNSTVGDIIQKIPGLDHGV